MNKHSHGRVVSDFSNKTFAKLLRARVARCILHTYTPSHIHIQARVHVHKRGAVTDAVCWCFGLQNYSMHEHYSWFHANSDKAAANHNEALKYATVHHTMASLQSVLVVTGFLISPLLLFRWWLEVLYLDNLVHPAGSMDEVYVGENVEF